MILSDMTIIVAVITIIAVPILFFYYLAPYLHICPNCKNLGTLLENIKKGNEMAIPTDTLDNELISTEKTPDYICKKCGHEVMIW